MHQIVAPAPAGEYPALPEPRHRGPEVTGSYFDAFTADQMRAYVDADRAMRAQAAPADPLDTPLPCDLTAGGVTIGKGCPLRTVQLRLQVQADANALLLLRAKEATTTQAAPAAVAVPSERWRERWHGSPTEQGWSIMHGRECIAYLGPDVSAEAVSAIVAAHNAAPTTQEAPPQEAQEPVAWRIDSQVVRGRYITFDEHPGLTYPNAQPLYTAPQPAPAAQGDALPWLQANDMAALERFAETTDDDESYDIGKEAVQRLAGFGCLRSHGFGKYSITDFGHYVLNDWSLARELPFKSQSERDAARSQAKKGGA